MRPTYPTPAHPPTSTFPAAGSAKNIWYQALADAGLTHPARIHDLRHTNTSWMLAGGADLETIRERLGHSLRATEPYLHTLPNTHNTALTALHRTRTTNPPSTPAPGQLTVTNPTPQQTTS